MFGFSFPGGDETLRLTDLIKKMREGVDKKDIQSLLVVAKSQKPSGDYDDFINDMRRCYLRDQEDRAKAALQKSLPKSAKKIRPVPIDIITETAEIDAKLYRDTPDRWCSDGGVRARKSTPKGSAFSELVRRARMSSSMLELERLTCVAQTGFARIHWSQRSDLYGEQRHIIRPFWSSQVNVISGQSSGSRLQGARVVMLQLSGAGTEDKSDHDPLYEVWTQDEMVTDDGMVSHVWYHTRVTSNGHTVSPMAVYEERDIPIVVAHVRDTGGALFATPDRSLMSTQDAMNVANSDFWYGRLFGAHKQLALTGARPREGEEQKTGPDAVLYSPDTNASWTVLDMQTDQTTQDAVERELVMHGRTRRQPVDAWWTKGGNPETGVARQVRNMSSDEKRAEHAALFEEVESDILRIMARTADKFGDLGVKIDDEGTRYHVKFPPPRFFEDPTSKLNRLVIEMGAGLVSPARAAVEMGRYETEEDASAEAGLLTTAEMRDIARSRRTQQPDSRNPDDESAQSDVQGDQQQDEPEQA